MRSTERSAAIQRDLTSWCEGLVRGGSIDAVAVERVSVGSDEPACSARAGAILPRGPRIDPRSLFDLASLTKPWTATLALRLDAAGQLPLGTRVGDIFRGVAAPLASVRLADLLRHSAGLARWRPLYALCRDAEEARDRLLAGEWLDEPGGEVYSDLDYLLWGWAAEGALGRSYEELLADLLVDLSVADVVPSASRGARERGVACRLTTRREVELAADLGLAVEELPAPRRGTVQDGNARFLGGLAPHAGLFATAAAMAALAREWLAPGELLDEAAVNDALAGSGRFALGWFRAAETPAGRLLGVSACGHDGFTGGSMWLDRAAGAGVVMLAHRASLDTDLGPVRADLVRRAGLL